jgi:hypothetical protein
MELIQEVLIAQPEIDKVYFTEDGEHHFNAYKKVNEKGVEIGTDLFVNGKQVVKTLSREEVLAWVAEPEKPAKNKNDK